LRGADSRCLGCGGGRWLRTSGGAGSLCEQMFERNRGI
jgi:hypothetical protein